jgi:tetraacyldisaccharide 4'-kinase
MSWGNPRSLAEKTLVKLLWPASLGVGTASYMRMLAYNHGMLKQQHFGKLVLSVGNITVGGTGKTPVTIDLAQRLINSGRKVAVLSRGYRRLSKEEVVVVSDGRQVLVSSQDAGDEPYMIASTVPQATVIVGAKRAQTAKVAEERYGCDTIILDDGFQHFGMARDVDVVLVDYNDDLENDHLLPAGRLREPLSGLARADWVVITKVPEQYDEQRMAHLRALISRHAPNAELSACRMVPTALTPFGCPDVTLSAATLRKMPVFAFSGIARPEAFLQQLHSIGTNVAGQKNFPDHHWYTHQDVASIKRESEAVNAELVVTTDKDAVKLPSAIVKELPLAVLRQRLDWLGPIPASDRPRNLPDSPPV